MEEGIGWRQIRGWRTEQIQEKFDREGGNQIQAGKREDAADGFESDCRFGIANKTRETEKP